MKKRMKFRLAAGAIVLIVAMCDPLSASAAEGISGDFEFEIEATHEEKPKPEPIPEPEPTPEAEPELELNTGTDTRAEPNGERKN